MTKASLIVDDLGIIPAAIGEGLASRDWRSTRRRSRSSHRRPRLGCGADAPHPRPLAAAVRRLRGDARAGRVRRAPTTAATSRTTCWPRSRSSRTATSDVLDEYADARLRASSTRTSCARTGRETEGRLNEPHGVGFPLLIAPAYAIGGAKAVELFLAAIAALGVALGYRLALRVAPDPWALGARARGRAEPAARWPTAPPSTPSWPRRPRSRARRCWRVRLVTRVSRPRGVRSASLLLGALPWLGTKFVPGGRGDRRVRGARALAGAAPDARRRRRGGVAVLRRALRGDQRGALRRPDAVRGRRGRRERPPTPTSRAATSSAPTGWWRCSSTATTACCAGRRCSCWPFAGLWWLWRSHRERLARAVPEVREIEARRGPLRRGARRAAARRGVRRADDVRLLVPAAATCWPRCRWRSRSWRGGCATRRGVGSVLAALTAGWRRPGSTRTCAGATARSPPTGPTRRSARSPTCSRCSRAGGGWPFWLAGAMAGASRPLSARGARGAPLAPDRGRHAREVLGVAHERAPAGPAAVADRHLDRLDPVAPERQREHLRVVVVVRDARGRERAGREGAVAGLAVARRRSASGSRAARWSRGSRASRCQRHAVAPAEEARAEHVVGAPARDRLEHAREVGGVVLAVAVEVDGGGVALVARDARARCAGRRRARARPRCETHPRAVLARRSRAWRRASRRRRAARPRAARTPRPECRRATPPTAASSSRATTIARQRPASAATPIASTDRVLTRARSGRPRAGLGGCRHARAGARCVAASSSTERGSRETAPGTAPAPQTTNGTGRSPQSRWPWPPMPRPWPWSAIRITVASSSLPRSLEEVEERRRRAGPSRRAGPGTRGCARRARGRAGRRRAAGARAGRGPPRSTTRARLRGQRAVDLARSAAPRSPSGPRPRRTGRAGARSRRAGRGGRRARARRTPTRSRTPSRGAKLERMPCSAGVAPVSIDEKQTTVRAG